MKQILERLELIEKKVDKIDSIEEKITKIDAIEKRVTKIDAIEKKLDRIDIIEKRLDRLEPMVEESHQWIRALVENKEVHRAEMDSVKNDVSRLEGVLSGFDRSPEGLKKAE